MAFCTNCGTELTSPGRFCTSCGASRSTREGQTVTRPLPAAASEAVVKLVRSAGLAMFVAAALSLIAKFEGSSFFTQDHLTTFSKYSYLSLALTPSSLWSPGTAVTIALVVAGVFALTYGVRDPHWALGCTAGATLFTAQVVRFVAGYQSRGTPALLVLASGASIAGAVLSIVAVMRSGAFKLALDHRTAPYGLPAAAAFGLWSLLFSFSYKFLNFEIAISGSLFFSGKEKAAEVLLAAALAASAAFVVFVGHRGAIATASVVLTVPLFFIAQAVTDWPGHMSIGFVMLLTGVVLEIVVIMLSITADRAQTQTAEIQA